MNQTFNVNMVPFGPPVRVQCSQFDVLRPFTFRLFYGDELYQIPSRAMVAVIGTNANREGFSYICEVEGSEATFATSALMTAYSGECHCELVVTRGDLRLGSVNIMIDVEDAANDNVRDLSDTEYAEISTTVSDAIAYAARARVASEAATAAAELVSGYANQVENATRNAFAIQTADGNLADSGLKSADFAGLIGRGAYKGSVNSIDTDGVQKNAVYWVDSSNGTTGMPLAGKGFMVVAASGSTGYRQTIYYTEGYVCTRRYYSNSLEIKWWPWEWDVPPMLPGVEYRLTRKYNGKDTYAKLIDYTNTAAIGDTSKTVEAAFPHSVGSLGECIDSWAFCGARPLPCFDSAGNTTSLEVRPQRLILKIVKRVWPADTNWKVSMIYTKAN